MVALSPPHGSPVRINWSIAGVVATLLIQTIGLFVWGAKLDQRVANLEQRIVAAEKLSETVARVDERTQALVTTINRIDSRLSEQERRR